MFLLSSCSSLPEAIDYPEAYSGKGQNEVYVVSHGWHTGFVIPAKEIYEVMPALETRFGGVPNIEFGWGDKGFYQANEITTGLSLRAIFWPTESVVHAVAAPQDVRQYFMNSEVRKICLSQAELSSLVSFVANSLHRDKQGNVLALQKGIYGNSQFYEGQGDYYLMNTCNKWTAKGLKSVGMNLSPTFKLTASGIIDYLDDSDYSFSHSSCKQEASP